MAAPYTGPYQINPLELPANQNAAALYTAGNRFVLSIVDGAGTTWCQSPMATGGATPSFADAVTTGPAPSRQACATAALAVEQSRLQGRSDNLSRDITLITATP